LLGSCGLTKEFFLSPLEFLVGLAMFVVIGEIARLAEALRVNWQM